MSWKSVEMQVALPRTHDAGKLQDQMMKSNQHFQEALAQSQLIQESKKRKKVQEFEEIQLQKDDQSEHKQNEQGKQRKKANLDPLQALRHPYLGNNFDIRR
ncbi:hypothetical protein [Ornithinibacillus contaminans]|uniref:hypothetical protein n=1 Tax=Ornithinibacillus contaminans TaxID=694055 RepID=UPI00064DD471|nr:hypothetical protein [Ornithinibacillus contaminans]